MVLESRPMKKLENIKKDILKKDETKVKKQILKDLKEKQQKSIKK